jgi:hypothetical protein
MKAEDANVRCADSSMCTEPTVYELGNHYCGKCALWIGARNRQHFRKDPDGYDDRRRSLPLVQPDLLGGSQ